MVEREHVDSVRIAPSAHYTGYVWFHHRLTEPAFVTVFDRWVYGLVVPINRGMQPSFELNIEDFLLQKHLMIDACLTQVVGREGVVQAVEMACGLSSRGRRFRQRYPQLRCLEADLSPMAACKVALFRDQGWLGLEHAVAAVDILAEDGKRSLAVLFVGLDRECPLVVIIEGLVNYFQRLVIGAFWSRLVTEFERFPQGTYLTDFYSDLREYPRYRQIRRGAGIIERLTWGNYPLYYRNAAEIKAAFVRCGFASILVLDPQCEGAVLGLPQGRLSGLVRVIGSRMA